MTGSRDVRGRRLFSDRRGRLSLQVRAMRALAREHPFRRHLERSEAESKFAKWSVRNGANRANNVSERSKNDYR